MNNHSSIGGSGRGKLRRIQIGVFALTLAILLIQAWAPLLNPEKRAEKLYNDSWFVGSGYLRYLASPFIEDSYEEPRREQSIAILEKALELSPGNSLYEQALVWRYPEASLPKLLAKGNLGAKARMLAYYRYYVHADKEARSRASSAAFKKAERATKMDSAKSIYAYPTGYWRDSLARSDELIAADPDNAQAYYMRALIYGDMEQPAQMIALVRKANMMPTSIHPYPDISATIEGTLAGGYFSYIVHQYPRDLSRHIIGYGNLLLREGKADEAIRIFEDCCQIGIRLALQRPASSYTYSSGMSIFNQGWRELETVYRDFGYRRELRQRQQMHARFLDGRMLITESQRHYLIVSPTIHLIIGYFEDFLAIMGLTVIFAILWLVTALVGRRKGRASLHVRAWGERWLLWRFLAMYMSALVLLLLAARAFPGLLVPVYGFLASESVGYGDYTIVLIPVALFQVIILSVVVSQLRRRYAESVGTKVGIWRFLFRVPVEVRAWVCRSITLMFAAQMVFVIWVVMVGAIYLQASQGFYPWQPERMKVLNTELEHSAVLRAVQGLEERSSTIRITE